MSWSVAHAVLESKVVNTLKNADTVRRWLAEIPKSPDAVRMGVCLAIDIRTGALPPGHVAAILDNLIDGAGDPCSAFAAAIRATGNGCICASKLRGPELPADDRYLRVLSLADFTEYYVTPSFYYTMGRASEDDVRTMFFSPDRTSLETITSWHEGSTPRVWVSSCKEVESLAGTDRSKWAQEVNDALGLGFLTGRPPSTEVELVGIIYPEGFDLSVPCVQPSTLDANWDAPHNFFAACENIDGWGRTQSCSGRLPSMRERVHSHFKNLSAGYITLMIGRFSLQTEDRGALLAEVLARFARVS